MEPTPRARALAAELARVLKGAHDLVLALPAFDPSQAAGELVFALSDRGVSEYGPLLQARLAVEAPRLRIRFEPQMREDAIARLDWDVDLAVVSTVVPLDPARAVLLTPERLVGVARPDHPFCQTPPDAVAFGAARFVVVHSTVVPSVVSAEVARLLSLEARTAVTLPYWLALPPQLHGSDLVALVPTTVASGLVRDAELGVFRVPIELPSYLLSIAWSGLRAGDPLIAWMVGLLQELFRAQQVAHRAKITLPAP